MEGGSSGSIMSLLSKFLGLGSFGTTARGGSLEFQSPGLIIILLEVGYA